MATVQVILRGMPAGTTHDTDNYPVILQFGEEKRYEEASWIVPSYPGHIPAYMLSEIRVLEGPLSVVVDGPGAVVNEIVYEKRFGPRHQIVGVAAGAPGLHVRQWRNHAAVRFSFIHTLVVARVADVAEIAKGV